MGLIFAFLWMLVTPAFAARPSSPPGRVITGGSFWASDPGVSGSVFIPTLTHIIPKALAGEEHQTLLGRRQESSLQTRKTAS